MVTIVVVVMMIVGDGGVMINMHVSTNETDGRPGGKCHFRHLFPRETHHQGRTCQPESKLLKQSQYSNFHAHYNSSSKTQPSTFMHDHRQTAKSSDG